MTDNNRNKGYSICIPIYNQNVERLVRELHRQASLLNVPFEFLLMDDCSQLYEAENSALQQLPSVRYVHLSHNVGRSAIRNKLAENAQYETLIIMDCDALPVNDHFIENYLKEEENDVVIGGCQYPDTPPMQTENLLRWVYGKKREERSAALRNQNPHCSFTPFNLLIKKQTLLAIRFDESLKGYGHEDTLLGWQLKKAGIPVKHIDNPLIHNHQDKSEIFLAKTKEGIFNLWQVYEKMADEKEAFANEVKSLKCFVKLQKWGLVPLVRIILSLIERGITKNLLSQHPIIRLLDLYKLLCLCNASKGIRGHQ